MPLLARYALPLSLGISTVPGCFEEPSLGAGTATDSGTESSSGSDSVDPDDTGDPSDDTINPTGDGCMGCLDMAGGCLPGNVDNACGALAAACVACGDGSYCDEGTCTPTPDCTPDNCDGCCDGDTCQPGDDIAACGHDGQMCSACPPGGSCNAGSCELPCADNCDGCCDDLGNCIALESTANDACGMQGEACMACPLDFVCDGGACISTQCAMTCNGCCMGGDCMNGDEAAACGIDGASCVACPRGTTCNGSCEVDPGSLWDVLIISAELPPLDPNGFEWDGLGGAPDPYFQLDLGADVFETAVIDDTYVPVWDQVIAQGVPAMDLMQPHPYAIYDADTLDDDLAGSCMFAVQADQFDVPLGAECLTKDGTTLYSLTLRMIPNGG